MRLCWLIWLQHWSFSKRMQPIYKTRFLNSPSRLNSWREVKKWKTGSSAKWENVPKVLTWLLLTSWLKRMSNRHRERSLSRVRKGKLPRRQSKKKHVTIQKSERCMTKSNYLRWSLNVFALLTPHWHKPLTREVDWSRQMRFSEKWWWR